MLIFRRGTEGYKKMCCVRKLSIKHTLIRKEKEGRKGRRRERGREGLVTTVSELPTHMAPLLKLHLVPVISTGV